ncbi:hypothetical protein L208DRAFT_1405420 [Tricholoma matsutake]|nr:hypothetical protein L208DRAFT_1405420 [Tricholoma matsutake 945]
MLLTEQEVRIIQADYAVAKAAGVNLDGVEWLSKEVIESRYGPSHPVCRFPAHNLAHNL